MHIISAILEGLMILLSAENRLTLYGAYVINIAWKESMLDHYLPLRKNIFAT
jgi:hypothetical protein